MSLHKPTWDKYALQGLELGIKPVILYFTLNSESTKITVEAMKKLGIPIYEQESGCSDMGGFSHNIIASTIPLHEDDIEYLFEHDPQSHNYDDEEWYRVECV